MLRLAVLRERKELSIRTNPDNFDKKQDFPDKHENNNQLKYFLQYFCDDTIMATKKKKGEAAIPPMPDEMRGTPCPSFMKSIPKSLIIIHAEIINYDVPEDTEILRKYGYLQSVVGFVQSYYEKQIHTGVQSTDISGP